MSYRHKVTRQEAIRILNLWYDTTFSMRQIADKIGTSKNAVQRVISGVVYQSLPRPEALPSWRY